MLATRRDRTSDHSGGSHFCVPVFGRDRVIYKLMMGLVTSHRGVTTTYDLLCIFSRTS